ncbi:putative integrase catalytic subunit [Pseudomonas aeruginosa]|nr:putative integrase catalytic subunit [Pseudomonas aeruginosa]RCH25411.1 putative integrase catalytic subunit [Pseudomonas aeruginosa]
MRSMKTPNLREAYVCRKTIYNAIYALPVGELRKELSSACAKARRRADRAMAVWIGAA